MWDPVECKVISQSHPNVPVYRIEPISCWKPEMLHRNLPLPIGQIHEDDHADDNDEELTVALPVKTKPKVSFSYQVDSISYADKPTDKSADTVSEINTSEKEDSQLCQVHFCYNRYKTPDTQQDPDQFSSEHKDESLCILDTTFESTEQSNDVTCENDTDVTTLQIDNFLSDSNIVDPGEFNDPNAKGIEEAPAPTVIVDDNDLKEKPIAATNVDTNNDDIKVILEHFIDETSSQKSDEEDTSNSYSEEQ